MTNGNDEKGDVDGLDSSPTSARSLPQMPPSRVRIRTQFWLGRSGVATSPNRVQAWAPTSHESERRPATCVARYVGIGAAKLIAFMPATAAVRRAEAPRARRSHGVQPSLPGDIPRQF